MNEKEPVLTIVQYFDVAPEAVFKAWSEPKRVQRWWGPHGFTMPFCKIDFRVGGIFHYCIQSPDGKQYWGKGVYREIEAPHRIVCSDSFSNEAGEVVDPIQYGMDKEWPTEATISVTFQKEGSKTKMVLLHHVPETLAKRVGADKGWSESVERLSVELTKS